VTTIVMQLILIYLGEGKPKGIYRMLPKVGQGHLCIREQNLGFNYNYIR
jgi:hypothetical protein